MTTVCIDPGFIFNSDRHIERELNNAVNRLASSAGVVFPAGFGERLDKAINQFIDSRSGGDIPQAMTLGDVYDFAYHRVFPEAVLYAQATNRNLEASRDTETNADGLLVVCYTLALSERQIEDGEPPDDEPTEPPVIRNPFPNPADAPTDPRQLPEPEAPGETGEPRQPSQPSGPRSPAIPPDRARPPSVGGPRGPRGPQDGPPVIIVSPPREGGQGPPDDDEETPPDDDEETPPEDGDDEDDPLDLSNTDILAALEAIRAEVQLQGELERQLSLSLAQTVIDDLERMRLDTMAADQAIADEISSAIGEVNTDLNEGLEAIEQAIIRDLEDKPEDDLGSVIATITDAINNQTSVIQETVGVGLIETMRGIDNRLSEWVVALDNFGAGLEAELKADAEALREKLDGLMERAENNVTEFFAFDLEESMSMLCEIMEFIKKLADTCNFTKRRDV